MRSSYELIRKWPNRKIGKRYELSRVEIKMGNDQNVHTEGATVTYNDLCLHPKLLSNLAESMERPEPFMKLRRQVPPSHVSLLSNFIDLSFYFYSFGYHKLPCTINIVYMWIFQLFSTLISVLWEQSPCFECLNSLFSFHCLVDWSFYFHTQLGEVIFFLKVNKYAERYVQLY